MFEGDLWRGTRSLDGSSQQCGRQFHRRGTEDDVFARAFDSVINIACNVAA